MIARAARARSGITLTEILIAILIMGVGLISLATLFPLGLIRLREATRSSRAGLTFESAADDMDCRSLFYKPTFTQTWYWTLDGNNNVIPRDPFVQDSVNGSINSIIASSPGTVNGTNQVTNTPLLQSGLPFCYDPLWRSITGVVPNTALANPTFDFKAGYVNLVSDARFGAGVFSDGTYPYLRKDPGDNGSPSAKGLQRLTNFIPWSNVNLSQNNQYAFTSTNALLTASQQPNDVAGTIFASNDDIVFNSITGNPNSPSPLIPDMSSGSPQADYRFTWFVTGKQVDAGGNGTQFSGEVVVCDNRPFGFDPLPSLTTLAPAGETAVEAIFGYGKTFPNPVGTYGFATADKTVLLRWPANLPDPQVKVGGWICDVTYETDLNTYSKRATSTLTTFARCYWYQIGKRTDPQADVLDPTSGYRSMEVTITSPVRAKTLLATATGLPYHLNVALVMPSVINVYPRAFEVH